MVQGYHCRSVGPFASYSSQEKWSEVVNCFAGPLVQCSTLLHTLFPNGLVRQQWRGTRCEEEEEKSCLLKKRATIVL